jgi:hypothetical protein
MSAGRGGVVPFRTMPLDSPRVSDEWSLPSFWVRWAASRISTFGMSRTGSAPSWNHMSGCSPGGDLTGRRMCAVPFPATDNVDIGSVRDRPNGKAGHRGRR